MNAFVLKIIALSSMVIDHAGVVFIGPMNWARVAGRLAFPIYVFLIAEGFRHTRNAWKFTGRLALFAIISEPFFDLALQNEIDFLRNTNIFYTLALAGAAIAAGQKIYAYLADTPMRKKSWTQSGRAKEPYYKDMRARFGAIVIPALPAALLAEMLTSDYGAHGVAFILAMYHIRAIKPRLAAAALFCLHQHLSILQLLWEGVFLQPVHYAMIPATLAPLALLYFYNGKRGPGFKWAFYIAYPAHLALLTLL